MKDDNKYVVIDLEMCKIFDEKIIKENNIRTEIIEIGAVLINENLEIKDTFKRYVSPQYGILDNFIKELTGIKYTDIKTASIFETAIKEFFDWIPKDSIIVSWSENDKTQIEQELLFKNIDIEQYNIYLENWTDSQQEFTQRMNANKPYSLSEALVIADINYDENIHDALVDANNTALLFIKMKKEEVLQLNKEYNDDSVNQTYTYNPFEDLFMNNNNNKNKKKK